MVLHLDTTTDRPLMIYRSRNSSGLTSQMCECAFQNGSTGVEIQVVLHPRTRLSKQCLRSTGVEIQVVLHPKQRSSLLRPRSTGVEIQVVLHRVPCYTDIEIGSTGVEIQVVLHRQRLTAYFKA